MMKLSGGALSRSLVVLRLAASLSSFTTNAAVIISEIADKGSSTVCGGGNDWIELYNAPSSGQGVVSVNQVNDGNEDDTVDLSGYVLHDDDGITSDDIYTFPQGQTLAVGEYLVLCTRGDDPLTSPQFKIGGGDTLTLVDAMQQLVSSVTLPDGIESGYDVTYAWDSSSTSASSAYSYTSSPTPNAANTLTPVVQETAEMIKERLRAQNAMGTSFFGMDDNGYAVEDSMEQVLDLHLTMEQSDYDYMIQNASFQVYSPFTSARVVRNNSLTGGDEEETLLVMESPGRLRPKGQSTLYVSNCLDTVSMPFLVEFNTVNQTQTLFGVERIYLRMHFDDNSNMREWAAHRMLARFGLPHLRARTMRFFINGQKIGFYTVMEAVDQEYVFARSFPNYTPDDFALYKVKSLSIGCGSYSADRLEDAQVRMQDTSTPPYAFERGEHREKTTVQTGEDAMMQCFNDFFTSIFTEFEEVEVAYLRHNEECGAMLVQEGIIDRDLGTKDWDPEMEAFINEHLANNTCDKGCGNSNMVQEVDVDNFLRSFAFYAATIMLDSPLGNGNNYYLAAAGSGWAIVGFDHNLRGGSICDVSCDAHLPDWSILRPTCGALEDNQLLGPLLTNATLHAQYVEYVREFTSSVLANESFTEEMMVHAAAIEEYVKEDYWSPGGGAFFYEELSPDAAPWNSNSTLSPLLAFYKARAESINEQLAAYDQGTFPRGPHLDTPVEAYEICPDWRVEDTPVSACPEGCFYDGCKRNGFIFLSWCDEASGVCYQGEIDDGCADIPTGERYDGMTNTPEGRDTFCVGFPPFFSMKTNECPELTELDVDDPPVIDGACTSNQDEAEPATGDDADEGTSGTRDVGTTSSSSSSLTSHCNSQAVTILLLALASSCWSFA